MNKVLQIALLLTAVDKMSDVVDNATKNVDRNMQRIKKGYGEIMTGMAQAMSGKMLYDGTVKPMSNAFNQVQDHATNLRIAMMKDGGSINEAYFGKMMQSTEMLSEKFGESRNEYLDMFKVLKSNHLQEGDIFGKVGQEMAAWSKLMETSPVTGTKFIAGLKNDLNLTNDELIKMMDLTQRLHLGEGVGQNGQEAIDMLKESFSIASLGMTNLKYTGFNAARDFSAILVPFLRRQIAPETMGTGFRKIWANMLDKDKMAEFDRVAATFGKKFEFFDKQGNFMGLENFMRQMDLFKGMSMPDVNSILMPLTGGKTGLSSDVFKILAQEGSEGFNAGLKSIYAQGEMHARLTERMKQQSVAQARLEQMWNNAKVQIGSTLLPMMANLTVKLMHVVHAIKEFATAHPTITATVFKILTFVSAVVMLSGSLKILKGIWWVLTGSFGTVIGMLGKLKSGFEIVAAVTRVVGNATWYAVTTMRAYIVSIARVMAMRIGAMMSAMRIGFIAAAQGVWATVAATWAWTTALLANPMTWIVLAIVAAIAILAGAVYLVIKYWKQITTFFKGIWEYVKGVFMKFIGWLTGVGATMWTAGKNIVMSIYNGIKSALHKPIEAIKGMVQKIRNMLPFSPAKEGPLRDIHRIRLIETIAENIKPTALLEKMRSVAQTVFQFSPVGMMANLGTPNASGASGGLVVHYAPVYQARPGASFQSDKEDFLAFMAKNKREVVDVIQDEFQRRQSRAY